MLEGRQEQFIAELHAQGESKRHAKKEVEATIDRLIYSILVYYIKLHYIISYIILYYILF